MSFAKYPVTGGGGGGGGGGISGPGTTTNNGLVLWDGLDGTTVKDGGVGSADQVLVSSGIGLNFSLIGNANIGASAAIDYSKLATLTADRALVSSGSGFVSASSVTATELGLLSGRSTGLVDTASTQTIGGSKTFSSGLSAPTILLSATSNQMSFGSGTNKITINVPNAPAANLTYSFPNIQAVSLTGTVCLLEGANQTFTGANTTFTQTVFFNSTTPLYLGDFPNRIILSPGSQASPRTWLFPDLTVDPTFAALEGTQTFSGNKTFSGTLVIPASITMGANTFARSGAHNLTLTTAGATNVTLPTSGTLAILGANTFTAAQTITAASNQLVLSSGVNQLTLNSGTSAAARTYSVPDVGTTGTFALLEGAQTFSGTKTFSSGLVVTGGSAANGGIWFASNVLRQRGGTSGWAVDNTSGTAIISATDAGAVTVGPSSFTGIHTLNGVLSSSVVFTQTNPASATDYSVGDFGNGSFIITVKANRSSNEQMTIFITSVISGTTAQATLLNQTIGLGAGISINYSVNTLRVRVSTGYTGTLTVSVMKMQG